MKEYKHILVLISNDKSQRNNVFVRTIKMKSNYCLVALPV